VDDLLKTPASVFTKIQFGGLLGLANHLDKEESKYLKVENIYQLLEQAVTRYESVENIPYPELVSSMTAFKIKRKR